MKEINLNFRDLKWADAPEDTQFAGAKIKMLRDEGLKKTFLVKLPEGFQGQPHVFTVNEQHIVFEGAFEVEGITYEQGDYRFIPAGNAHDGKTSKGGAIILIIQDPPLL